MILPDLLELSATLEVTSPSILLATQLDVNFGYIEYPIFANSNVIMGSCQVK
jgi:hypothetical protein